MKLLTPYRKENVPTNIEWTNMEYILRPWICLLRFVFLLDIPVREAVLIKVTFVQILLETLETNIYITNKTFR